MCSRVMIIKMISLVAPEWSFVVSAAKCRGHCKIRLFLETFFPNFPVSRKVPKTGVAFVATADASGEVERVICLGKKVFFLFVL